MKKKDKQLLLKDLCGRFPHGVRLHFNYMENSIIEYATIEDITKLKNGDYSFHIFDRDINDNPLSSTYIKFGERFVRQYIPYLRPMSSMTEEEILHMKTLVQNKNHELYSRIEECGATGTPDWKLYEISYIRTAEEVDYLNSRHLDWRGLINKGLAIEAPEGMYEK